MNNLPNATAPNSFFHMLFVPRASVGRMAAPRKCRTGQRPIDLSIHADRRVDLDAIPNKRKFDVGIGV